MVVAAAQLSSFGGQGYGPGNGTDVSRRRSDTDVRLCSRGHVCGALRRPPPWSSSRSDPVPQPASFNPRPSALGNSPECCSEPSVPHSRSHAILTLFSSAGDSRTLRSACRLVVGGPYRLVRNPMYLGAGLALAGAAAFYQSLPLLGYAGLFLPHQPRVCRVVRGACIAPDLRGELRVVL